MSAKKSFFILFAAILLAAVTNGLEWQGIGKMNNTVIAKIWDGLEQPLNAYEGNF